MEYEGLSLIPMLFFIAFGIFMIAARWKMFEKAGKPGWAAIIPIYNFIVFLEIVGKPIWWIFLLIVPIANIVVIVWTLNMLSKSFGKDEGFTAGLFFFGFIFVPILGFGDAQYEGPYGLRATASNNDAIDANI